MALRHTELLEAVAELAQLAASVALQRFREGVTCETKDDGSPVTDADRAAEAAAREWLGRFAPGDAIVGEEFGVSNAGAARCWYLDPIDGTRSFVRGVPLWGSVVAVEEAGTVLAGAICCPATGDLVVAALGEGCWHNGARAWVSQVERMSAATILATDFRFGADRERRERWNQLTERVALARSWGDCYGYVLVATGRAELMVDHRLNTWDCAPLLPIVSEAGGVITDWTGEVRVGRDAVATNARLAQELRAALGVPYRMSRY
jgi:histidinol phosphatase-like enzyme (inositol monophosphatase family)